MYMYFLVRPSNGCSSSSYHSFSFNFSLPSPSPSRTCLMLPSTVMKTRAVMMRMRRKIVMRTQMERERKSHRRRSPISWTLTTDYYFATANLCFRVEMLQ